MLKRRIIPCLDVRDGRVVKGVRFSNLRDAGDPVAIAREYERQGADEIALLDVSATPEGRATNLETVRGIRRALSIPLCVGGGVRSVRDAQALLEAGADKVAVNTAAVNDPHLITALALRFGVQCTVLAMDAAERTDRRTTGAEGNWCVIVQSGRRRLDLDAVAWAKAAVDHGAGEILLTSWDRDGTRDGYDVELLAAVSSAVSVPVIASGGAAGVDHMIAALAGGADAVLAASIFHDGECTVGEVKVALAGAGLEVRR